MCLYTVAYTRDGSTEIVPASKEIVPAYKVFTAAEGYAGRTLIIPVFQRVPEYDLPRDKWLHHYSPASTTISAVSGQVYPAGWHAYTRLADAKKQAQCVQSSNGAFVVVRVLLREVTSEGWEPVGNDIASVAVARYIYIPRNGDLICASLP